MSDRRGRNQSRLSPAGSVPLLRPASFARSLACSSCAVLVSSCTVAGGAPSIALFGAYFPSWLACALAGILGAVIVRFVFIPLGIDDVLPVRLPVYVAIAAAIGFLVSLIGFGR